MVTVHRVHNSLETCFTSNLLVRVPRLQMQCGADRAGVVDSASPSQAGTTTLSNAALLQRIRDLISAGDLPAIAPALISAGYGTGDDKCWVCGQIIEKEDVDYEASHDGNPIHLHVACHLIWQHGPA